MIFTEGINKIYTEDIEFQKQLIEAYAIEREIDYQVLLNRNLFYVPNDEYLIQFFGIDVAYPSEGLYEMNECKIYKRIAIPIPGFNGEYISLCGYDNGNELSEGEGLIKYLYQPKSAIDKGKLLFIERDKYIKAYNEGYIFITDGLFDQIRLDALGYNIVSLCGSTLTPFQKLALSKIKNKVLIQDRDKAGEKLFKTLKEWDSTATRILVPQEYKDADNFLRTEDNIRIFNEHYMKLKNSGYILSQNIT